MKNIVLVLLVVLSFSCSLNEDYGRIRRTNTMSVRKVREKEVYIEKKVYIDVDGNEITDPEIIAEIENQDS